MALLWSQLTDDAALRTPLGFFVDDAVQEVPWSELVATGERIAGSLRGAGVERGSTVGIMLQNNRDAVAALLGVWFAGGAVASLPVRVPGMDDQRYVKLIESLCGRVDADLVVADPLTAQALAEPLAVRVVDWSSLGGGAAMSPEPPGDDDVAFIQCTSGTTSMPKGVMLTVRAIAEHNDFGDVVIAPPDGTHRMAGWAPLSHNMGMFGSLLWPVSRGVPTLLSPPMRFALSPATWFDDIVNWDATITVGPSAGLGMAVRHAARRPPRGSLAKVQRWLVGAERIDWDGLLAAHEVLGPHGLSFEALAPAYGMAEATTAVSSTRLGEAPYKVTLDSGKLADRIVAEAEPGSPHATDVVCVGRAPASVTVRTADPVKASELVVASPALSVGYRNDPELTAEKFRDGELMTGDIGFIRDGDVFVVGREDDMLSVAGRKVYAREVEDAIGALDGTYPGGCSIVDVPAGRETRLVLLLEASEGAADHRELATSAARIAASSAGMPLHECLVVEPGTLPRTSTGKIQRFRCRQLVRGDDIPALTRVKLR